MALKETIVIDDIVPKDLQDKFEQYILGANHWKLAKDMSYANDPIDYPSYGFNAMFKHPEHGVVSNIYEAVSVPIINAFIEKTNLKLKEIYYNRAFLQVPLPPPFFKGFNGVHIDIPQEHYACVYYVTDSDGDTIVYEETADDVEPGSEDVKLTEHKRVNPKKGRLVAFDGKRYHCSSQPRGSLRCIINFDLLMKE